MTDLILQIGASKLAVSVVLAGVAWAAQRRLGCPSLSHALWLLLLCALLVPPMVSVPVLPPEIVSPTSVALAPAAAGFLEAGPTPSAGETLLGWIGEYGREGSVWLWISGMVSVLGWTLAQTLRFQRSLVRASEEAPPTVQHMARRIARRLGLESAPIVHVTHAQLSPMVWWAGGKVRVLLPSPLLAEMEASELDCVLAHELAHIRRRDHVVRWIEWLACSAFWWNPVAWWARRRMRTAEELCCDTLALASCDATPRSYARSLLRAINLVSARPSLTLPALASTAHRPGRAHALEERFKMIVAHTPSGSLPPRLRAALRFGAVCVLAVGLVYCTDQGTPLEPGSASALDLTVSRADIDGDGDLDLVVRGPDRAGLDSPAAQQPAFYLNDGNGVFHSAPFQLYADTLVFTGELPSGIAVWLREELFSRLATLLKQSEADLFMSISARDELGEQQIVTVDLAGLRERLGGTLEGAIPGLATLREFVEVESSLMGPGLSCRGDMAYSTDPDGAGTVTLKGSCERLGNATAGR